MVLGMKGKVDIFKLSDNCPLHHYKVQDMGGVYCCCMIIGGVKSK